ncbi:MAG: PqqD family protein [Kiloniellales bacterium]|nr:PqqD family protein [Kiloniellales bacterium]
MIEKVTISSDAVAKALGDETVILHLGTGTYFGLDSVGTRVWELLAEDKSPAEICEVMLNEYEVSREDLERDVEALIEDLLAKDLISTS